MRKKIFLVGIISILVLLIAGIAYANPIINPISDTSVDENTEIRINITNTAPDSGSTAYSDNVSFGTLQKINDTYAQWYWTPGYTESGVYTIEFNASDSNSSDTESFTLTVNNVNRAPSISSSCATAATVNESYSCDVDASDADGDTITYSLQTTPTGMSIDSGTGVISWTPNSTGTYSVTVRASDGSAYDEESWSIEVKKKLMLEIYDLKVYVDGDKDTSADEDGGTIDNDVRPGSEIKMTIELKNLYDSSDDINIENIDIEGIIYDIDDGDDIDESDSISKIKPRKKESVTLIFKVPKTADEDSYDMDLTIDAEDENGDDQSISLNFTVEVERKKHDVLIDRADLASSILSCNRNTDLDVKVYNIGDEDEDEVVITVENSALDVDYEKKDIQLDSDPDDDYSYSVSVPIDISDSVSAGDYELRVKVYYSDDVLGDLKDVDLTIKDCATTTTTTPTTPTTPTEEVEVITPSTSTTTTTTTTTPTTTEDVTTTTEIAFTDTDTYLIILLLACVAAFGLGVIMVVALIKK